MSDPLNLRWTFMETAAAEIMSAAVVEHRFDEHFHENWAIGCIDRGVCSFTAAGRPLEARAGDLVIIPPYTVHTGGTGGGELAYRMAYVGEGWLSSLSEIVLGARDVAFSTLVVHDPSVASRLSAALVPEPMAEPQRRALLVQALVALLARHASPRRDARTPRVSSEDARDGRLLRALGGRNLSRSALIHRFTRRFGLSPLRYERNLRCVSAKALLRQGMPIVEAAQALGFSDQAHFTREFKKVHHITPGGYRRLFRARGELA